MSRPAVRIALVLVLAAAAGLGCVTDLPLTAARAAVYAWFVPSAPDDPWAAKIRGWQAREHGLAAAASATPAAVSGPGAADGRAQGRHGAPGLREKYLAFRTEQRRAQAREVAEWIQAQAREHYRPDGPIDHWATLAETLDADGDDCDGLELLVFYLLRDLGFGEDEVFRAIVYRPEDGQHHMVTLWFDGSDDPWVIDPTGAMTRGMPRLSQVPGWVPLRVFDGERRFTVTPAARAPVALARPAHASSRRP